jgi:hypothetical protein
MQATLSAIEDSVAGRLLVDDVDPEHNRALWIMPDSSVPWNMIRPASTWITRTAPSPARANRAKAFHDALSQAEGSHA